MNNSDLLHQIQSQFPEIAEISAPVLAVGALPETAPYRDGHLHVQCPADQILKLANFLKSGESLQFDFLTMVTAVDFLKVVEPAVARMEVVYHLFSFKYQHKLVIKISVPRENAAVESVISVWPTADWQEREVYDMYGIRFLNHPNCSRILMWEGFPGWPLKKDFAHIPDRYDD